MSSQRRLLLGAEAISLGRGGVTLVAAAAVAAAGVGRVMVTRGVAGVRAGLAADGLGSLLIGAAFVSLAVAANP